MLLAIAISPINLIEFEMSKTNREYIDELYSIGELLSEPILEPEIQDDSHLQEEESNRINR